jgi:hypothetical protein
VLPEKFTSIPDCFSAMLVLMTPELIASIINNLSWGTPYVFWRIIGRSLAIVS